MNAKTILLVSLVVAGGVPVLADTVHVHVPLESGDFGGHSQLTTHWGTVAVDSGVQGIVGASVRFKGEAALGAWDSDRGEETMFMDLTMGFSDSSAGVTWTSRFLIGESGDFDGAGYEFEIYGLDPPEGETLEFLVGRTTSVFVMGGVVKGPADRWPITPWSTASIDSAFIVFDIDTSLPAHSSTWGGIKSSYR